MYSTKKFHLDNVVTLLALLENRSVEPNFQDGIKVAGKLSKQVVVNVVERNGYKVIDGHYYELDKHKFRFDIMIIDLATQKFQLTIYKKKVTTADLNLIYDEVVRLKRELVSRNNQKGGPKKEHIKRELYIQSGRVKTTHSKMRFIQAWLDDKYSNDLLEIYREMNFKVVGKGSYPDLKNWKEEANRLGVAV